MWGSPKQRLWLAVSHRPSLMLPILRMRLHNTGSEQIVTKEAHILIEGAGGSANTFAQMAFVFSQCHPTLLSGHTHSPAQVIQAAKWNIPTLVLIRPPLDSVTSLASRRNPESAGALEREISFYLARYIHFYKHIIPHRENFCVGEFSECITDFGAVICRVNVKFCTDFTPFVHDERNMRECFGMWRPNSSISQRLRKQSIKKLINETDNLKILLTKARTTHKIITTLS